MSFPREGTTPCGCHLVAKHLRVHWCHGVDNLVGFFQVSSSHTQHSFCHTWGLVLISGGVMMSSSWPAGVTCVRAFQQRPVLISCPRMPPYSISPLLISVSWTWHGPLYLVASIYWQIICNFANQKNLFKAFTGPMSQVYVITDTDWKSSSCCYEIPHSKLYTQNQTHNILNTSRLSLNLKNFCSSLKLSPAIRGKAGVHQSSLFYQDSNDPPCGALNDLSINET